MLKPRSSSPYWASFKSFQSFNSKEEVFAAVSAITKEFQLSDAYKKVLNTIKLHSQTIFGVCWLKVAEIAKRAKVSARHVQRAIKDFRESGIISVVTRYHDNCGGQSHNVYVINSLDAVEVAVNDAPDVVANDVAVETPEALSHKDAKPASAPHSNSFSNSQSNLHNSLNTYSNNRDRDSHFLLNDQEKGSEEQEHLNLSPELEFEVLLKDVPKEFVDIFSPFYANEPQIILARWKTACVSMRKNCFDWANTSWNTVREAWMETVRRYKSGKTVRKDADGLGGYFYQTLSDRLAWDYAAACSMA